MSDLKARVAKCRKKKKEDDQKWKDYLEKDRDRKRASRLKEKAILGTNKKLCAEKRKKDRERQRLYRLKKKTSSVVEEESSDLGSYKSPRTLGKAVKKVKNVLPKSPAKRKAVFKRLIREQFGPNTIKNLYNIRKKGSRQVSANCKQSVLDFYNNDEISRQAPGKRDVKSVKDPVTGKRGLVQIRHMVLGIGEAYEEYKQLHPEEEISKSKFYNLRPKHVLPLREMPHTVCVCIRHANFSFLIEAISKSDPSFPKTHKEFLERVCCDVESRKCMESECKECVSDLKTLLSTDTDLRKQCKWKEWKTVNNRPKLVENTTTLKRMLLTLQSQLTKFKIHTYVKRTQSKHFESCKKSLLNNPGEAVMQLDFAENYAIIEQDEIQSAHWNHSQVTIFTCCIWHLEKVYSFAIVSDDLSHNKNSVWMFLKTILTKLRDIAPAVNKVNVFSDNCAGQFKSRYTVSNVCYADHDFDITLQWNFFASGHGKGAVDGVGGSVKRTVWREVLGRRSFVSNPLEFYKVAKEKCSGICVLFVSHSEINANVQFLNKRWNSLIEIHGIQSMHHFQKYDEHHILVSKTGTDLMLKVPIVNIEESSDEDELECSHDSRDRVRFIEVYTDSSDSELNEQLEDEPCNEIPHENLINKIVPGNFILVKLLSSKGKEYRYVAVCQGEVKPSKEVDVAFLRSYGTNQRKLFRISEEDEKVVCLVDILTVLEEPEIKMDGNRVTYCFSNAVNVFEQ